MFEYDPAKSAANKAKHGIDFDEAQIVWWDGRLTRIRSKDGSNGEERWLVIGQREGRLWSVVITYRGDNIRIISARRSRGDEAELYGGQ